MGVNKDAAFEPQEKKSFALFMSSPKDLTPKQHPRKHNQDPLNTTDNAA